MNKLLFDNNIFFREVEELISQGKMVHFRLKGRSMEPFLLEGCKITIAPVTFEDIKIGDIVFARWKNGWVLHRILVKGKNHLFLIGDGNLWQVERVDRNDFIAILSSYIGKDGEHKNVSKISKTLSFGWFLLRPIRILIAKLNRTFKNYNRSYFCL